MHQIKAPLLRTAVACGLLAVLAPPGAGAATVTTAPDGALVFTAAPGERNQLGVQSAYDDPSKVVLYDGTTGIGTNTPAGCTRYSEDDTTSLTCARPPVVRVDLGDGDDRAYVSLGVSVPVTFLGGPGNDDLQGNEFAQTPTAAPATTTSRRTRATTPCSAATATTTSAATPVPTTWTPARATTSSRATPTRASSPT